MSIPGPGVHQQLLDAYDNVQSYLESERESILDAKSRRQELDNDRGSTLDSLAEHYLPELTQQAIAATWTEVRDAMMQILHRKGEHLRRVDLELTDLKHQQHERDLALMSINESLDQAQAEQNRIAERVQQQLREDRRFIELTERAAIAESALERAEANMHEIEQESARKLPAYNQSSLFRYLYDRDYGTEHYQSRGVTRQMDRWLARYIDYASAKQSYDFLSKTPDQMRKIIAEDREALNTVMSELEKQRDQVAGQHGLPDAINQTSSLEQERHRELESVEALLEGISAKNDERNDVADVHGMYYREAIRLFRELLQRHEVAELRNRAQKTEEVTDDQIVARLMGVDVAIGKLDDVARQQRARLDEIQAFLNGLGRIIQRFRAAQFDSSRSNFLQSLNIDEEVARAHEEGDLDELWQRIRRAQRWGAIDDQKDGTQPASSMQQILVNAMAQAARSEQSEPARRAGDRRAQQWSK